MNLIDAGNRKVKETMKTTTYTLLVLATAVACQRSEISQTIESNREWIENVEGVVEVTNSGGEIVVVASDSAKVDELIPDVLNDYKIRIITKGEKR